VPPLPIRDETKTVEFHSSASYSSTVSGHPGVTPSFGRPYLVTTGNAAMSLEIGDDQADRLAT
jgi:hypothetical protein